jgi:hypothetical protein
MLSTPSLAHFVRFGTPLKGAMSATVRRTVARRRIVRFSHIGGRATLMVIVSPAG